jgi:hypothetical protein
MAVNTENRVSRALRTKRAAVALLGAAVTGVMLISASQASASGSLTTNVAVQAGAVVYMGEKPPLCGRWCHHRSHGCGSWCGGGGHHRCHHRCHRHHDDEGCRRGDNFGFEDGCRRDDEFGNDDNCSGERCDSNDRGFGNDSGFGDDSGFGADGDLGTDSGFGDDDRDDSTNQDIDQCFGGGC